MRLKPGEIIDGKYRIVRLLGEGGMGAVYEGENTRISRRVAIKVLHASAAAKRTAVKRFEQEAKAAGLIGSEHIVEVLDLGELSSGEQYMVMEFLEGEDLASRIKKVGHLTPHEVAPILIQLLEGLGAAHKAEIIHRDLKPDNVFLVRSLAGNRDFVKVLDFGVSKFSALDSDSMDMTSTGAVVGTPFYLSPEQARGVRQLDGRSDLYSVGVVLYQAITGRVPFQAETFNELVFKIALESPDPAETVVPGLDPDFAAIIAKSMVRDPNGRFQSAREFQEALTYWLATHPMSGEMALPPPGAAGTVLLPGGGNPAASAQMPYAGGGHSQSYPGAPSNAGHGGLGAVQTTIPMAPGLKAAAHAVSAANPTTIPMAPGLKAAAPYPASGPSAHAGYAHHAGTGQIAPNPETPVTFTGAPRSSNRAGAIIAIVAACAVVLAGAAFAAYKMTSSDSASVAPTQAGTGAQGNKANATSNPSEMQATTPAVKTATPAPTEGAMPSLPSPSADSQANGAREAGSGTTGSPSGSPTTPAPTQTAAPPATGGWPPKIGGGPSAGTAAGAPTQKPDTAPATPPATGTAPPKPTGRVISSDL